MAEFIARIDGIKLSAAAEKQIAGEIQASVLRALAVIDTKGDLAARIPWKDWKGIRCQLRDIPELGGILKVNEVR